MQPGESTTLTRDVQAIRIPSGERVTLPGDTSVTVTQALGGSHTVVSANQPGLFRIQAADADALGLEKPPVSAETEGQSEFSIEKVWEQLRNCYDPEIPVNIVDLGLIYSLEAHDEEPQQNEPAKPPGKRISVKMTLTAPGCGMGPTLAADAESRILTVPGVSSAHVELVWEPQWSPERISQAGRETLGMA
jgi:probable FeS assembly SUF system protein SufT